MLGRPPGADVVVESARRVDDQGDAVRLAESFVMAVAKDDTGKSGSRRPPNLMSKNVKGGASAAATISALTNEVHVAAERRGERLGGRRDPPLVLVLDEVANICRIPDLPQQYSHLGSRSVVPIAIPQSYAQVERVWGGAA